MISHPWFALEIQDGPPCRDDDNLYAQVKCPILDD